MPSYINIHITSTNTARQTRRTDASTNNAWFAQYSSCADNNDILYIAIQSYIGAGVASFIAGKCPWHYKPPSGHGT